MAGRRGGPTAREPPDHDRLLIVVAQLEEPFTTHRHRAERQVRERDLGHYDRRISLDASFRVHAGVRSLRRHRASQRTTMWRVPIPGAAPIEATSPQPEQSPTRGWAPGARSSGGGVARHGDDAPALGSEQLLGQDAEDASLGRSVGAQGGRTFPAGRRRRSIGPIRVRLWALDSNLAAVAGAVDPVRQAHAGPSSGRAWLHKSTALLPRPYKKHPQICQGSPEDHPSDCLWFLTPRGGPDGVLACHYAFGEAGPGPVVPAPTRSRASDLRSAPPAPLDSVSARGIARSRSRPFPHHPKARRSPTGPMQLLH